MGKCQRRERPLNVGTLLDIGWKAGIIADDKRQAPGIGRHVPLHEVRKLIRCPGFPLRIQHHDTVGRFQGRKPLGWPEVCDLQRQEVPDSTEVVIAQLCQVRAPGFACPNHAQLHGAGRKIFLQGALSNQITSIVPLSGAPQALQIVELASPR